jgi:hypothetical protein
MAIVTQSYSQSSAAINGSSLEYFSQQIIANAPAAPDSLVQMTLQNTIRDFYYHSAAYRAIVGPYLIVKGQPQIQLNPIDQYSQVHLVRKLFMYPDTTGANVPHVLVPTTFKRFGPDVGPPRQYYMEGPDVLDLYPVPDLNYGAILYAYVILMPVINVGRLPNICVTHHFDGLFYGTLWRLGTMAGKPWTIKDKELLNEYMRIYKKERWMARDIAQRQWSEADSVHGFPNFAGRLSQSPLTAAGRSVNG